MAKCDVCGNDYDKSFQIISAGKTRTFDSFECAIHMLAPTCPHCNCKVIGHGVEAGGQIYCCVHCAEESGAHGLKDRKLGQTFVASPATLLSGRPTPKDSSGEDQSQQVMASDALLRLHKYLRSLALVIRSGSQA